MFILSFVIVWLNPILQKEFHIQFAIAYWHCHIKCTKMYNNECSMNECIVNPNTQSPSTIRQIIKTQTKFRWKPRMVILWLIMWLQLYEAMFKQYLAKHWQRNPYKGQTRSLVPPNIVVKPVRTFKTPHKHNHYLFTRNLTADAPY